MQQQNAIVEQEATILPGEIAATESTSHKKLDKEIVSPSKLPSFYLTELPKWTHVQRTTKKSRNIRSFG